MALLGPNGFGFDWPNAEGALNDEPNAEVVVEPEPNAEVPPNADGFAAVPKVEVEPNADVVFVVELPNALVVLVALVAFVTLVALVAGVPKALVVFVAGAVLNALEPNADLEPNALVEPNPDAGWDWPNADVVTLGAV